MHQTGYLVLVFAAHGHDVTAVAHGYYRFLQEFLRAAALDEFVQLLADIHSLAHDTLSYGSKLRACGVGHLLFGDDAFRDALFKVLYRVKFAEVFRQGIFHALALTEPVAQHVGFPQNIGDIEKFPERQRRAAFAAPERKGNVLYLAEARGAELRGKVECVVGFLKFTAYF